MPNDVVISNGARSIRMPLWLTRIVVGLMLASAVSWVGWVSAAVVTNVREKDLQEYAQVLDLLEMKIEIIDTIHALELRIFTQEEE